MKCPKCQGEQHCPCSSCADKNKGKVTWKWISHHGHECGHCGHTMSYDDWEKTEIDQYKKTTFS